MYCDICFVILNYNLVKETMDCVDSIIKNIDTPNYHIIIVDNGSVNNSGEEIRKKLQTGRAEILISKENLGYAKGNNLGIEYARNVYSPNYICCLNNDTLLTQTDFYTLLHREYLESNVAVIAPKVINIDSSVQKLRGLLYPIGYYENLIGFYQSGDSFYERKIRGIRNFYKKREKYSVEKVYENIFLNGCCLIFTPIFFKFLNGFNPKTFMYGEEQLLLISLIKNKLVGKYFPKLIINHIGQASTKTEFSSEDKMNEFYKKNKIKSCEILIEEIKSLKFHIILFDVYGKSDGIKLSSSIDKVIAVSDIRKNMYDKSIKIVADSKIIFDGKILDPAMIKSRTFDYIVICSRKYFKRDYRYLSDMGFPSNKIVSYMKYMSVCRGIKW